MQVPDSYEVLESVVVERDPVVDGFAGVLLELVYDGERLVLTEIAVGFGDLLLRIRARCPVPAYRLLEAELSGVS